MKSLLIVSVAVLVALAHGASATGGCYQQTTCTTCAGNNGCGWDAGMSKCKSGTVYGPNIGYASQWDWSLDQCPSNNGPTNQGCHLNTHCNACIDSDNCGWDARMMKCMAGNSTGPTNTAASGGGNGVPIEWSWSQCPPSPDCSQYSGCSTCTLSPSGDCGWNAFSGMCVQGTANGPAGTTTAASAAMKQNWKFTNAQCASNTPNTPSTDNCGSFASCFNCTRAASGACGWTGKRCLSGSPSGPTDATQGSSFWGWTTERCMQSSLADGTSCSSSLSSCSGYNSCMDCVNTVALGCSWDKYRSKCIWSTSSYGISSIVSNGSPSQCYSSSVSCNLHSTCAGCTTDTSGICGWDADNYVCKQGTEKGPVQGRTRQWVWKTATCPVIKDCSQLLTCNACNHNGNSHNELTSGFSYCKWTKQVSGMDSSVSFTCVGSSDPQYNGYDTNGDANICVVSGTNVVVMNCASSTTCVSCADRGGCGWDYNAQLCKEGSALGPNTGALPKQWDYTADQCATEQCGGTCESHTECGSCANYVNCGWDSGRSVCQNGNANGPAHPTVNFADTYVWQFGLAQCDYTSCSDYVSCYGCTENPGCGWAGGDSGDGMCSRGTSSGAFVDTGYSRWTTSQSSCGVTWSWRWSTKSMSMWLTFGLIFSAMFTTTAIIRRRNRRLRIMRAQNAGNIPFGGAAPTTAVLAGAAGSQLPQTGTVYGATSYTPAGAPYPYGAATYAAQGPSVQDSMGPSGQADANSCNSMPLMEEVA